MSTGLGIMNLWDAQLLAQALLGSVETTGWRCWTIPVNLSPSGIPSWRQFPVKSH